jgi:hypothetical protein
MVVLFDHALVGMQIGSLDPGGVEDRWAFASVEGWSARHCGPAGKAVGVSHGGHAFRPCA